MSDEYPKSFGPIVISEDAWSSDRGASLLEWYAGQALNGIISRAAFNQEAEDMMKKAGVTADHFDGFMASLAFDLAETMVKEAEKRRKK